MDKAQRLIRQASRDAALINTVRRGGASMELIQLGVIQIGDSGLVVDLTDGI